MSRSNGEDMLNQLSTRIQADLSNHFGDPAADRLRERFRKRFLFTSAVKELSQAAQTKFLAVNDSIPSATNLEPFDVSNAQLFIAKAFENYNSSLDPEDFQGVMCKSRLADLWSFGPGASLGVTGTHTAQKLYQPMTCTSLAEPDVRRLRLRNPYMVLFDRDHAGVSVVQGSKLGFVPKNEDTVRTIATEPSGNMALQLAAGNYIADVLRSIGLDIRSQQPKNKRLAQIGSRTGAFATIDLSSASDRISVALVRQLLPPEWFRYLMRLRSPSCSLPTGEHVELKMISTMGNGYTFSLMTLLITSLVYATMCRLKPKGGRPLWVDWEKVAVFGDDIIVETEIAPHLIKTLEAAGFVINHDKSYLDGPFRESCGGDYHLGREITPFYIRSLASTADRYVAINQVILWCAKHKIVLSATLGYLASLVPRPFLVPEWEDPSSGILTPYGPRDYKVLEPVPRTLRVMDGIFSMPLVCGGYVTSGPSDSALIATLRNQGATQAKRKVRRRRIPRGFCDGSDPVSRSADVSAFASLLTQIFF